MLQVYTAISVATYSPKAELEAYVQKHIMKLNKSSNSNVTANNTTLSQASIGMCQLMAILFVSSSQLKMAWLCTHTKCYVRHSSTIIVE